MARSRVLIVEDSRLMRRLLSEVLSADPELEVTGSVGSADEALAEIRSSPPSLVTLDVEMPGMSGLDLLIQIRKRAPRLPVIMFSSFTQRAAATTLEALARGASDYVTKPTGVGSLEGAREHVRAHLIPKIKALCRPITVGPVRVYKPQPPADCTDGNERVELVAIGASTGGPNALSTIFAMLPATFPIPIVVVQHMPPLFTRMMAERLSDRGPLQFAEAVDGEVLQPGRVLIAPGGHHLAVRRDRNLVRAWVTAGPLENSCRPAVDVLFRSVAETYGGRALAVVLTGMGQDGLKGSEQLRAKGARIFVQDAASSVVWGMPGLIAEAGLAHRVLPLGKMAANILQAIAVHAGSSRGH